ncbi:MAG TPA: bacillithiol system redox-active protein YtxJ [Blastocatellia bacterium]|nr:bacillithiol system redox-active protein YtxJ [Blastocatellia bacterium]
MDTLKQVGNVDELDQALAESRARPVLLFKHSTTCPISEHALRELKSFLDGAGGAVNAKLITVQTAPDVSAAVAERLGLRHESPQAILVRDGREVWNASHYAITFAAIDEAIRAVQR